MLCLTGAAIDRVINIVIEGREWRAVEGESGLGGDEWFREGRHAGRHHEMNGKRALFDLVYGMERRVAGCSARRDERGMAPFHTSEEQRGNAPRNRLLHPYTKSKIALG